MAIARFSTKAETDLDEIADFSTRTWGEAQSERYIDDLETFCSRLAATPLIGRACDEIGTGIRRAEHSKHTVFYAREEGGIVVLRILHQSMLHKHHSFSEI